MGLDDFGARSCRADADCDATSEQLASDPMRCGRYQCRDGFCVLPERELCNGVDDDCNGWIDEGIPVVPAAVERSSAATFSVAYADDPTRTTTYVTSAGDTPRGFAITNGAVQQWPLRYLSASSGAEGRCPALLETGGQRTTSDCDIRELALGSDSEHLVFASVNSKGCSDGQLQLAIGTRAEQPFDLWLGRASGNDVASNIEFGVGLTEQNPHCTGAADEAGNTTFGATRPAVAVADASPGGGGALALWLSAHTTADDGTSACVSQQFGIEGLGVFVPEGGSSWLQGVGIGDARGDLGPAPLHIGKTTSRSAPAVLALEASEGRAEYLVAFAGTRGGAPGIEFFGVNVSHTQMLLESRLFIPDPAPDRVTLARGHADAIGVAWSSGCGAERSVKLASLPRAEASSPPPVLQIASGDSVFQVSLAHDETGFSAAEPAGGWRLLWLESLGRPDGGRAVRFARVSDQGHRILSDVTLRTGGVGFPLLDANMAASVGYSVVQLSEETPSQLELIGGWCHDSV